jgi:hypothetical protein
MAAEVISVSVPAFADNELIYSNDETKRIFKAFYPSASTAIDGITIDNHGKRLAQTMVYAVVDASEGMTYVEVIFNAIGNLVKGGKSVEIEAFAKTLFKAYAKNWYKNQKAKAGLEPPRIYQTVILSTAYNFSTMFNLWLQGPDVAKNDLTNGYRAYFHVAV